MHGGDIVAGHPPYSKCYACNMHATVYMHAAASVLNLKEVKYLLSHVTMSDKSYQGMMHVLC